MDDPTHSEDLAALRELTLTKIGRNCFNFARMERLLRFIATTAKVSAPAREFSSVLAAQNRKFGEATMGTLADAAAAVLHSPAPPPPENLTEPWLSFEFSLAEGGSVRNEWRRAMREVARERNRLLHQRLAEWNPHSLESCRALCVELDEQRERMRQPHEHLTSIVRGIVEGQREAGQALRAKLEEEL